MHNLKRNQQIQELMDEVSWAGLRFPKTFRIPLKIGHQLAFIHSLAVFTHSVPPLLIQSKSGCKTKQSASTSSPKSTVPELIKCPPHLLYCSHLASLPSRLLPLLPRIPSLPRDSHTLPTSRMSFAFFLSYFSPGYILPFDLLI